MFYSFIAGGLCNYLLTALARYYFAKRLKRTPQRLSARTCTRAYFPPRKYAPDEPHAVHMAHHVFVFPPPAEHFFFSPLTEREKNHLSFLRYLIDSGKVSEEV